MDLEREGYVDWKGRLMASRKHNEKGGATIVCLVEVLENMVFISNASNLVTYFHSWMNYSLVQSANMLTNYMGTCFLLTLFGGFVSDTLITRFSAVITFGLVELTGLIILGIQAHFNGLHPDAGQRPSTTQAAMLSAGLFATAVGVGGIKSSLPAHGADQFDHSDKRLVSAFFNWFFFSLCSGGLLAVTVLVWVQETKGWQWSFGLSAAALSIALCLFAAGLSWYRHKILIGSPFGRILKVLVSTAKNWKTTSTTIINIAVPDQGRTRRRFRFLDKALNSDGITTSQVEETRAFLSLLPIFLCTIMMNCCLAQLQTFSVQQGLNMNRTLFHTFQIPTASLTTLPLLVMLLSVVVYDRCLSVLTRRAFRKDGAMPPLHRIGFGLVLATVSMAVAAFVEAKRREGSATLSVMWLGWQYLLLGVSDMFTLAGMLEFFYSEAPHSMRSVCTALSWCSTALGYFLSSLLVTLINSVSCRFRSGEWLDRDDLNRSRLDLFYALLSVLNFVNFLNYLYWAKWYHRKV